jgi:hypothetical protein
VKPVIQKFSLRDLLKKSLSFSKIFYLYMLFRLQQGLATWELVHFVEKPWLKELFADLLGEKNTVPAEKTS